MRNMISFTDFELLVENSSTTILDTYSNTKFSDVIEFLDFCSFKPFDYKEVPILSTDKFDMGLSWWDDDIVFEHYDIPEDDREEVLTFIFNELEDFFKENKTYFKEGSVFIYLDFESNKIYNNFYYKNPLKYNHIEVENKTFENKLKRKIENINDQIHVIYNVPILNKITPKSYVNELNKLLASYKLEKSSTLLDYKLAWIKEYLWLVRGHVEVPDAVINKLITKWSTNTITYSDIKKLPMSAEAMEYVEFLETKKQEFDKKLITECINQLGNILIDAIKEFAKTLKCIFDSFDKKIINNIDQIIKNKTKDSHKLLNKMKDLLNELDNIGGFDKLFFDDNRFIMNNRLYKKLNFINNNILVINKLK